MSLARDNYPLITQIDKPKPTQQGIYNYRVNVQGTTMKNTINSIALRSLQEKVNIFLNYTSTLVVPPNMPTGKNTFDANKVNSLHKEAAEYGNFDEASYKCLKDIASILICESQMINRWGMVHSEMAKVVKAYFDEGAKDKYKTVIHFADCREKQKAIIEASQKPDFTVPTQEPQYYLELFKAGSRDGYRSEWKHIIKTLESANLNERCAEIVNEVIGYYSDNLDFMIDSAISGDREVIEFFREVCPITTS